MKMNKPALVIVFIMAMAFCAGNAYGVSIYLDGARVKLDSDPVVRNGMVFVPLRGIFEKMGATVNFDKNSRTIRAYRGPKKIVLTQGEIWANVDGARKRLLQAPFEINGRTFVPLRFLSESLGCNVGWHPGKKIVSISSKGDKDPLEDIDKFEEDKDTEWGGKIDGINNKIDKIDKVKPGDEEKIKKHKDDDDLDIDDFEDD